MRRWQRRHAGMQQQWTLRVLGGRIQRAQRLQDHFLATHNLMKGIVSQSAGQLILQRLPSVLVLGQVAVAPDDVLEQAEGGSGGVSLHHAGERSGDRQELLSSLANVLETASVLQNLL